MQAKSSGDKVVVEVGGRLLAAVAVVPGVDRLGQTWLVAALRVDEEDEEDALPSAADAVALGDTIAKQKDSHL